MDKCLQVYGGSWLGLGDWLAKWFEVHTGGPWISEQESQEPANQLEKGLWNLSWSFICTEAQCSYLNCMLISGNLRTDTDCKINIAPSPATPEDSHHSRMGLVVATRKRKEGTFLFLFFYYSTSSYCSCCLVTKSCLTTLWPHGL